MCWYFGHTRVLWHSIAKYCLLHMYNKGLSQVCLVRRYWDETFYPLLGWTHSVACMSWGSGSVSLSALPGKRKALKLNFANPPVKPASRLPLPPTPAPSFQNPHMWVQTRDGTSRHLCRRPLFHLEQCILFCGRFQERASCNWLKTDVDSFFLSFFFLLWKPLKSLGVICGFFFVNKQNKNDAQWSTYLCQGSTVSLNVIKPNQMAHTHKKSVP